MAYFGQAIITCLLHKHGSPLDNVQTNDVDGTECEIGMVAVWDPPSRLILIWQLTPDFKFDPNLVTEVEVLFTAEGDGTRVELEHRDLERFGERSEAMRETISGPGGWPMLLGLFAEQAKI